MFLNRMGENLTSTSLLQSVFTRDLPITNPLIKLPTEKNPTQKVSIKRTIKLFAQVVLRAARK